ncbi:MAG: inositol monophosphatase family protein, partial [Pseudomonadota bacterium]
MTGDVPKDLLEIAHRLADAAAEITLASFRTLPGGVENKAEDGAFDPVTAADKAAEAAMRAVLEEARPQDTILGAR